MTISNTIQSGFINTLARQDKILTPGVIPNVKDLESIFTATVTNSPSLNQAAIAVGLVAVAGTALCIYEGFEAIDRHFKAEKNSFELFKGDCKANITQMSLKELQDNPSHNSLGFFKKFVRLLQQEVGSNGELYRYANIYHQGPNTDGHFAVMNMASFSFVSQAHTAQGDNATLDHARNSLDHFLQSSTRIILEQLRTKHPSLVSSIFSGHLSIKEVHEVNIVRFMVMALTNISLNLKYPADLNSDDNTQPLDDSKSKLLCAKVEELIDKLSSPDENDSDYDFLKNMPVKEAFNEFLKDLKQRIENLKDGYQSKILNELNFGALVSTSRSLLACVNKTLTQTLFPESPLSTNELLISLVEKVSINFQLNGDRVSNLCKDWCRKKRLKGIPVNFPLKNAIDLIALYASNNESLRQDFLNVLKGFPGLDHALSHLSQYFISPIEKYIPRVGNNPFYASSAYLIQLIGLVEGSCSQGLDNSVRDQLVGFNTAYMNNNNFRFSLSIFDKLKFKPDTLDKLKNLINCQYRFMDALRTEIILKNLLDNNKYLLIDPSVRAVTKKAGNTLRAKAEDFKKSLDGLVDYISVQDEASPKKRRDPFSHILHPNNGIEQRFDLLVSQILQMSTVIESGRDAHALIDNLSQDIAARYDSHAASRSDLDQIISKLHFNFAKMQSQAALTPDLDILNLSNISAEAPHELLQGAEAESDTVSSATSAPAHEDKKPVFAVVDEIPEKNDVSAGFGLQTLASVFQLASTGALIIGLSMLAGIGLGAALSLPVGALLSAVGTIGLVSSYFFKPAQVGSNSSSAPAGKPGHELRPEYNKTGLVA